jgi:hypothetical protein
MMLIFKSDQDELWRTIQNTFMSNPTQEAMNTLGALVDSLATKGGLPMTAPDVWRVWAKKSVR